MPFKYKNYMLVVLMSVLAWSYVDRMVFGLALQQIKIDLDLTDTQLGFLSGLGFALFFSVLGIPIARWADRGNRVAIVSLTTAVFSIAVSLCSMAGSFVQLFFIRIGIAAGEAGCSPPANSLIPDYFNRAERPRASGVYTLGLSLGLILGYFAGGWLLQWYGWRPTFLMIGLPGLALAILVALTLREPRRLQNAKVADGDSSLIRNEDHPSFKQVLSTLWAIATFRRILMCFLVWYFCGWALHQWEPAFFIRSHGLKTGELGTWLAVAHGAGGLLGAWLGGELASRYAAHDERLQLIGSAVVYALCAVFSAIKLLAPHYHLALAMAGVAALLSAMPLGAFYATLQTMVPANMRAPWCLQTCGPCHRHSSNCFPAFSERDSDH